jgi:hypothetical protein
MCSINATVPLAKAIIDSRSCEGFLGVSRAPPLGHLSMVRRTQADNGRVNTAGLRSQALSEAAESYARG